MIDDKFIQNKNTSQLLSHSLIPLTKTNEITQKTQEKF